MNPATEQITFIQSATPALPAGEYKMKVEETVNQGTPDSFSTCQRFVVSSPRFALPPADIHTVFPPTLANGAFSGVLPQAVLNRRTLPWERRASDADETVPWLAVLVFNDDEMPQLRKLTAADLITMGQPITALGSNVKGTGSLSNGYLSYPGLQRLDYGELPTAPCTAIDIPVETFNQLAPCIGDLAYLAHIREVDTRDAEEHAEPTCQYAVVMGNRVPRNSDTSHAFLVSLEHFCKYLPDSEGKSSLHLPDGTTHIRLLTYRHWQFSVNLQSEAFQSIMSHVNRTPSGQQTPSSLQFPFDGPPPTPSQVQMALSHQAQGALSDEDAQVLVHNAFTIRYNPETGLFDVSYGAAWQLGQLLALQNKSFATALYRWKQRVQQHTAVAAEHKVLTEKLQGIEAFAEVFAQRQTSLETQPPPVPDEVVSWLVRLRLLYGVPFNYWVPGWTAPLVLGGPRPAICTGIHPISIPSTVKPSPPCGTFDPIALRQPRMTPACKL